MRSLIACVKKEMTEQLRSGKLVVLGIVFLLFGIMNPAVAKLTPWLLEMMSESLAQSGMDVTITEVTALDSWVQFFKNIPMALIVFVLLEGGIFTREYTSGTLVLSLTKGLPRLTVLSSKGVVLCLLWSVGYWLSFGVTYAYTAFYWDNSLAQNLMLSVVCWWLFGLFVVSLMILFSVLAKSGTLVLLGTGGVVMVCYLFSMVPVIADYLPTALTNGNGLIYGVLPASDMVAAVVITAVLTLSALLVSIPLFNKKQI